MKHLISGLLSVLILLSLISCDLTVKKADPDFTAHSFSKVDSITEITAKYTFEDFINKHYLRMGDYYATIGTQSSYESCYSLSSINDDFPVEYVYTLGKENIAIVYRVTDNAEEEFYLHLIFKPNEYEQNKDNMDSWKYCPRFLVSTVNETKYKDGSVYEGMTLEELVKVFPETAKYHSLDETYPFSLKQNIIYHAVFVLNDGFLKVFFDTESNTVREFHYVQYTEDLTVDDLFLNQSEE